MVLPNRHYSNGKMTTIRLTDSHSTIHNNNIVLITYTLLCYCKQTERANVATQLGGGGTAGPQTPIAYFRAAYYFMVCVMYLI